MGLDEEIDRLRRDVTAARQRAGGLEASLALAETRVAAAREDLQAEFGVTTVAAARAALGELEERMQAEAGEVRRQLELAGGTR